MNDRSSPVPVLFEAAGLTVPDDELRSFVEIYPLLRAQADALSIPELDEECPALGYDPLADWPEPAPVPGS